MNDEELFEKIQYDIDNKLITICETCDTAFPYSPQKNFCDECNKERQQNRPQRKKERYANDPEFREKLLEYNRKWEAKKKQEDPEWYERRKHRSKIAKRLSYKRKKQEEE